MTPCKRGHAAPRTKNGTCVQCQSEYRARRRLENVKFRARQLYDNAKHNAALRGRSFTISAEYVQDLLIAALNAGTVVMGAGNPRSPSLDRIESDGPYHERNVQIVPRWFNIACRDWKKEEAIAAMRTYLDTLS